MKLRLLSVFIALAVVLGLAGGVIAAPTVITGVTFSPNAGVVGSTTQMTIQFTATPAAYNAVCVYAVDAGWDTNFPASVVSNLGDTYTKNPGGRSCPVVSGRTATLYDTATANEFVDGGDILNISVIVPSISTGAKTFVVRQYTTSGNPVTGLVNTLNGTFTVQSTPAAPATTYASNQSTCGGYGTPGVSCFQSLSGAINALSTTGTEVVIVGEVTGDSAGATVPAAGNGSALVTIRGINSAQLTAPSGCSGSPLTIAKSAAAVAVYSFIIDGTACPGQVGLTITGNAAVSNLTVQNFSSGTGVAFSGTGTGSIRTSVISANGTGVADSTSAALSVGTGPSDGNTLSNNATGIGSNGGITIKGNMISGGTYGVELTGNATAFYGNRITGANTQHVRCNGATAGAAWNFLGGTSPASGSNCPDVDQQLGSDWVNWSDAGLVSGLTVGGAVVSTFDLGNNLPFQYGSTAGRTSNYYAVYDTGTNSVTVGGTGTTQYKMFVPPNTGSVCPTGTEHTCWDSATNGRAQSGTGYYYKGSLDPTAVTLRDLSAESTVTPWPLVLAAVIVVAAMLALGLILRRRAANVQ